VTFFMDSIKSAARAGQNAKREVVPFTIESTAPLPGRPIRRQWEFVSTTAGAIKLICPRRSGKTVSVVKRTCKHSWEQPGRRTLYINHTLGNAKRQFFDPPGEAAQLGLLGTFDAHGIGYSANSTEVFCELDNGSFVQGVGCDNLGEVRKKLGFYWHEVIIDEIQEYAEELLDLLIRKALAPTLIQTHGTLVLSGTPPYVLDGLWYDVLIGRGGFEDYEEFRWAMLDNPCITKDGIAKEMAKAGFVVDFDDPKNNHPIVQREVFGLIVKDPSQMVYEYEEGRNDIPASGIPMLDAKTWVYAIGIDVGGVTEENDEDAIVVLGWRTDDPKHELFERESWTGRGDSEEFADRVVSTIARWRPIVAKCGDTGGGGNKAMATISKRARGIEFTPKPTSVELSQRLVNDELRSGRLKLNPNGEVAKAAKTARKGKHEPDAMASCRYAHHCVANYLAREPVKKTETYEQYLDRNIRERQRRKQSGTRGYWRAAGGGR
jgi:hypothetical protein